MKKKEYQRIAKLLVLLKNFGINPYNISQLAEYLDISSSKIYSISDASFLEDYFRIIIELGTTLKVSPLIFLPESLTGLSIEDACYDEIERRRRE